MRASGPHRTAFLARTSIARGRSSVRGLLGAFLALLLSGCGSGSSSPALGADGGQGGDGSSEQPTPPGPYPRPSYRYLSETGLFADVAERVPAAGVEAYEPAFALFSDGADKRRWVALPPGTVIDTSDLDHWTFPIGSRFAKEFSLDGRPLETRVIERYGSGKEDFFMGAFVWNADGTDAELRVEGAMDVLGTPHDAPTEKQCWSCHNGEPGRILGFSALQLAVGDSERAMTFASLAARDRLSDVPPDRELVFPAAGDTVAARALGYLHANCGHCHNLKGTAWPDTQMVLRVNFGEDDPATSELYRSVVGREVQNYRDPLVNVRVVPGSPDTSALLVRMRDRGSKRQMPPLGTERPDVAGIDLVSAWIESLPVE